MRIFLTGVLAALTLAGCVTHPSRIEAVGVDVQMNQYADYTCNQLVSVRRDAKADLKELSDTQASTRKKQSALNWVFLAGSGIAMQGRNMEAEIALLKGKVEALENVMGQKGCRER